MYNSNCIIVDHKAKLKKVVDEILEKKSRYAVFGYVIVVDKIQLKGILSVSDLIKVLHDQIHLSRPISDVMNSTPVVFVKNKNSSIPTNEEIKSFVQKMDKIPSVLPIVDEDFNFITAIETLELLKLDRTLYKINVYGMGFVGLTLATALANVGFEVCGIEKEKELINDLGKGKLTIHEDGLDLAFSNALSKKLLKFKIPTEVAPADVHIIAVGTPIKDGRVELGALEKVTATIGKVLKPGNQVIVRSTVPAGTTSEVVKPILEAKSSLIAGSEFSLAFAPERTIEGKAYQELFELPQLVGGYTDNCASKVSSIFTKMTQKVIFLNSLEEAEFCKLLNNSYRDLMFSFSNAFALSMENKGLDGAKIIEAAGYEYPRGKIPAPSPGVGGYCLPKDPHLLALSFGENSPISRVAKFGRSINEMSVELPINRLNDFKKKTGKNNLIVLILGVAFKGEPDTNDLRGSTSLAIGRRLSDMGDNVFYKDFVISDEELSKYKLATAEDCQRPFDALLVLNNNKKNISGVVSFIDDKRITFICDAWSLLSHEHFANNVHYSSITKNYW